ncbi:MAG TPA: ABC transporter permease [Falsiroseomonas sp.]|jgi:capsular polysaccharide transport system permease protein|nr:ABC transporter permease [Falsiroseomonas sp.]
MSATSWADRGAEPARDRPGHTAAGLRVQLRVIHALVLREMQTRFGRSRLGMLTLFLEPVAFAGMMAGLRWAIDFGHTVPGVSIFVFALVSYLPFFTFRAIVSRAPGTVRSNMTLLYHAPIRLLDVVLARHALEAAAVVSVMTFIVIALAIWADAPPHDIPVLFLGLVLLFLYAHGLGLAAAALSAVSRMAAGLIAPLLFISLPLSGAIIAVHMLDPTIQQILLWNPQVHIHEMVREGFFGDKLPSYFDVGYLAFWCGVVNLIGLAALRVVRPRLEV